MKIKDKKIKETKTKKIKDKNKKIKDKNKIIKDKKIKNNHKYLCYTNLLLSISFFYFVFNIHEETPFFEYVLASLLIATIICSQLFWSNPIKKSKIHKLDAIIAKIVIFSFIFYTLLYKFMISFLFILLAIAISSYYSNYYSSQEWCSNHHLCWHGSLHIFCFIASFYAFFENKITPI
jgi:hypothetical protein